MAIRDTIGEALTKERVGVGVKTRWFYQFHWFSFKWDDEVTVWDEGHKIEWKSISTWRMVDSFTIEPTSEGCRLVYKMDYTPPYGFLEKLYYRNRAQESMQPVAGTLGSVSCAEGGIRTHQGREISPANSLFLSK